MKQDNLYISGVKYLSTRFVNKGSRITHQVAEMQEFTVIIIGLQSVSDSKAKGTLLSVVTRKASTHVSICDLLGMRMGRNVAS